MSTRMETSALLRMDDVSKRFGNVQALDSATFEAARGEVHALLGENGAGKTTLMNVLAGIYKADAGSISLRGSSVSIGTPRDAVDQRVGMVHQHFELVQVFTAFENIVVGAGGRFTLDEANQRRAITEMADRYGIEVPLDRPVRELAVGEQQKVAILRALYGGLDILILDEPTTHLTPAEVDRLFGAMRELVATGLTVILISHKLREVLASADRITVLRRGRTVGTMDVVGADERAIVSLLMGDAAPAPATSARQRSGAGDSLLELRRVRSNGSRQGLDLDLVVRGGELLGVAGVAGNGQRELCDVLSGIRFVDDGTIHLAGRNVTRQSVAERIKCGLAIIPEGRLHEGVLPSAPLYESYHLGLHQLDGRRRWNRAELRRSARNVISNYRIAAPGEACVTANLSGGNIQKLLVARAFAIVERSRNGLVVAMNPTRGLDIGSASFVHQQMDGLCRAGHAVMLVSEDLDELMTVCDRIVVLQGGSFVAEFPRDAFDRHAIGGKMVGASLG